MLSVVPACVYGGRAIYRVVSTAVVISSTGGPSGDKSQVPREVSEVPCRHGSLGHLGGLPETAGSPLALNQAGAVGAQGGTILVESPFQT